MKVIISGYGVDGAKSIAQYEVSGGRFVGEEWSCTVDSPSFLCQGDGFVFGAQGLRPAHWYFMFRDGKPVSRTELIGCSSLCHITYSPKNRALYGTGYASGNVFTAGVDPERGCFTGEHIDIIQGGNAHSALLTRDESTLYVANLGLDKIFVYSTDGMKLHEKAVIQAPKGSGPRHTCLSADERLLYVITELSNQMLVCDTHSGRIVQTLSTLPAGTTARSACSTLCFSPDRKRLYGANRYTDTIAVFSVQQDGTLEPDRWFDCGGKNVRHFTVLSDGTLAVCNIDSNAVMLLDPEDGHVTDVAALEKASCAIEVM